MSSYEVKDYWFLIREDNKTKEIINYSIDLHTLISLFRRELESKIYNPVDTWLYKNNPTEITVVCMPIESLCLNLTQVTTDIIDYYYDELEHIYTLMKINNDHIITLYHNDLPSALVDKNNIDICLLDIINIKLHDIYDIYNWPWHEVCRTYDTLNIRSTWSTWFKSIMSGECPYNPTVEEMMNEIIKANFQIVFTKYCNNYNNDINYFDKIV